MSLHTPIAQLDSALALFADVFSGHPFQLSEFERIRKNRLTELIQLKDRPTAIANQAYASILYGASHPYGQALIGTEASITGMATTDLELSTRLISSRTIRHSSLSET